MERQRFYVLKRLRMLHAPLDHLRLHIEGLEPQAEVRGNAEEGLTYDNKCREVEKGIRG